MSHVSLEHEAPLEVLRQHPEALLELLRLCEGAVVPEGALVVQVLDTELSEATPSVRRADFVTLLRDAAGETKQVVVLEIQRDRDDEKLFAWPLYVAHLHAQHRVPTTLLVMTFDTAVTAWARAGCEVGPSMLFSPLVIGPDDLPEIRSVEEARAHPELSVLTALARLSSRAGKRVARRDEEVARVFEAMLEAEDVADRDIYISLLHGIAEGALQGRLDKLREEHRMGALEMIFNNGHAKGKAEGKAEGKVEGKAEGEALAILKVLRARGLDIDDASEARIRETRDVALLDAWLERAVTIATLEALFAE